MRDVGLSARGPGGRMLFRLGWVMPYPIAYSITPSTTGRNAYRALMLLPSIRLSKNSPPFERQRKEYSFGRGLVKPGIRASPRRSPPAPSPPQPAPRRRPSGPTCPPVGEVVYHTA